MLLCDFSPPHAGDLRHLSQPEKDAFAGPQWDLLHSDEDEEQPMVDDEEESGTYSPPYLICCYLILEPSVISPYMYLKPSSLNLNPLAVCEMKRP